MKTIAWNRSEDGYVTSKDGRWSIEPEFWGRQTAQGYKLVDTTAGPATSAKPAGWVGAGSTQAACKEKAERILAAEAAAALPQNQPTENERPAHPDTLEGIGSISEPAPAACAACDEPHYGACAHGGPGTEDPRGDYLLVHYLAGSHLEATVCGLDIYCAEPPRWTRERADVSCPVCRDKLAARDRDKKRAAGTCDTCMGLGVTGLQNERRCADCDGTGRNPQAKPGRGSNPNSHFQRGMGVFTCGVCKKRTRGATGVLGPMLCQACYDEAGLENEHSDGYHDEQPDPDCPMCKEAAQPAPATAAEPAPAPAPEPVVNPATHYLAGNHLEATVCGLDIYCAEPPRWTRERAEVTCPICNDKLAAADDSDLDPPCPGCGCRAGDGLTEGCEDVNGCGYYRHLEAEEAAGAGEPDGAYDEATNPSNGWRAPEPAAAPAAGDCPGCLPDGSAHIGLAPCTRPQVTGPAPRIEPTGDCPDCLMPGGRHAHRCRADLERKLAAARADLEDERLRADTARADRDDFMAKLAEANRRQVRTDRQLEAMREECKAANTERERLAGALRAAAEEEASLRSRLLSAELRYANAVAHIKSLQPEPRRIPDGDYDIIDSNDPQQRRND